MHWDDFFRSLDEPLRPMVYLGDSLADGMRRIVRLAEADGVELFLPVAWLATDPFAGSHDQCDGGG